MEANDNRDKRAIIEDLDRKLALFFFACSIAFVVVEHPLFLEFINALVAAKLDHYVPPCRQTLSNSVLNRIWNEVDDKKRALFDGTNSILIVDGWTNKKANRKYMAFSLRNNNCDHAFFTCRDFSMESEDAENLASVLEEVILEAFERFNTRVYAVVTDNASSLTKACRNARILLDPEMPNQYLLQSTCNSHSANRLIKSFINEDQKWKLGKVVQEFRRPGLDSLLQSLGGTKLQNFTEIRFCYFRDSCQTVSVNYERLRQICQMNDVNVNVDPVVSQIILHDDEFRLWIEDTIRQLDPLCCLINKCQSPKFSVAEATEMWLNLDLEGHPHARLIEQRIEKAIYPIGHLANVLHPDCGAVIQNPALLEKAEEFLYQNFDQAVIDEYDRYFESINDYDQLAEACETPYAFWTLMEFEGFPRLSELAKKIMIMPASTAMIEGMFSSWTYVHNTYRNRLTHRRSCMLIDIYYSIKHHI